MDIFLVGGAVRDKLLGYPFSDRDWVVVGATPDDLLSQGFQAVGKDFPVFLHPETKEEYALARTERKTAHGYTGFQCYSSPDVTLEEDLMRRDLTINAMAESADGTIVDPYHGQQDLDDRWLRHVSPAFIEDPLRVLRTARFYARYHHLGFRIAAETTELCQTISASGELQHLSQERVWQELESALKERSPAHYFFALQDCEAAPVLFPQLSPLSEQQAKHLHLAAEHSLSLPQRLAMLFFELSEEESKAVLTQLKAPNEFKELALMASTCGLRCSQANNSAEEKLNLIQQLDAFRRPERFEEFLECCGLFTGNKQAQQQLQQAFQATQTVDAKTLAAQGLKGAEIGKALREQRLLAIQQQETL